MTKLSFTIFKNLFDTVTDSSLLIMYLVYLNFPFSNTDFQIFFDLRTLVWMDKRSAFEASSGILRSAF